MTLIYGYQLIYLITLTFNYQLLTFNYLNYNMNKSMHLKYRDGTYLKNTSQSKATFIRESKEDCRYILGGEKRQYFKSRL